MPGTHEMLELLEIVEVLIAPPKATQSKVS